MADNDKYALQPINPTDLAAETNVYTAYLAQVGLPVDNIIATTEERAVVATNLPAFLQTLSPEEKRDARYLSKFVGATAVGLFDAALNYVWNEVVLFLSVFVVAHLVAGVEMRATDKAFMNLGTPLAMKIQGLRPIFIGVEIR